MKLAIYNGRRYHYEVIGHILEYSKDRFEVDVFADATYDDGWLDFYKQNYTFKLCKLTYGFNGEEFACSDFNHSDYDKVILITDDDYTLPETPDNKVICIEHTNTERRRGSFNRITFKYRENIPLLYPVFSLPKLPKFDQLTVCSIGYNGRNFELKFKNVNFIKFSRENNLVPASYMIDTICRSHYILLYDYEKLYSSTSSSISLSLMAECLLLTDKSIISEYNIPGSVDYDSIDNLEFPTETQFLKVRDYLETATNNRNIIYNSLLK
jgi:hypothetical protein